MSEQISNRTLAVLLVGAIAVSLFGTFISLEKLNSMGGFGGITGMATNGTGYVQLDVTGLSSFTVVATTVNFGTIVPNASTFYITTNTDNVEGGVGATDCTGVTSACSGIELMNDGNEVINVSFNTSSSATDLIGGTAPFFAFHVRSGNRSGAVDQGCNGSIPFNSTGNSWHNITPDTDYRICNSTSTLKSGFGYVDSADSITLEFNLSIPADAPVRSGSQADLTIFVPLP